MLKTELSKFLQPQQPLNGNPLAKELYKMLEREGFTISDNPTEKTHRQKWMGKILTLSLNENPSVPSETLTEETEEHLFKRISIKGIKKIPTSDTYKRIEFCDNDGIPVSTVIMGENGVGKSSFYGSLEYVGMGEMKTAQLYGLKEEDYILNLFARQNEFSALLSTTKEELKYDGSKPKRNCLPAFYISEWDIREIEKSPNFGSFIFSQLGMQSYNLLLSFLIATRDALNAHVESYKADTAGIRSTSMEVEALKFVIARKDKMDDEEIATIIPEDSPKVPTLIINNKVVEDYNEIIASFKRDLEEDPAYTHFQSIHETTSNPLDSSITKLKEAIDKYILLPYLIFLTQVKEAIEKCQKEIEGFVSFKNELKQQVTETLHSQTESLPALIKYAFDKEKELTIKRIEWEQSVEYSIINAVKDPETTNYYLNQIIEVLKPRFNELARKWTSEIIEPTMQRLLKEYLDSEQDELKINYSETFRSIYAELTITEQKVDNPRKRDDDITPHQYFNTFRFKMFAVSLKIALACCAKAIYNTNWPIVIDDVFNSSDFDNRSKMNEYIERICEAYESLDAVKHIPLQLIFFTQDDVIGDAVFKGLRKKRRSARLLRLHDHRCFADEPETDENENDVPYVIVGKELDSCHF